MVMTLSPKVRLTVDQGIRQENQKNGLQALRIKHKRKKEKGM